MLLYQERNSFLEHRELRCFMRPCSSFARGHCCCMEVLLAWVLGHRQVGGGLGEGTPKQPGACAYVLPGELNTTRT